MNCLHSFIHSCWLDIDLTLSQRPYEIHSATPIDEILNMFKIERVHYSSAWCKGMVALLKKVRKHKHLLSSVLFQKLLQQRRGTRQAHTLGSQNFKVKKAVLIPRLFWMWVCSIFSWEAGLFPGLDSGLAWPERYRNLILLFILKLIH